MPLSDPFAVQTPQEQAQQARDDAYHAELKRVANNTIRVYNPTDEDFYVTWEGLRHRIPAKGSLDTTKYIAETYCRDMNIKLINDANQKKGDEILEKRMKSGAQPFESKWHENQEVWNKLPRTDDPKLMAENYAILWLGTVKEWGRDDVPVDPKSTLPDFKTDEEKILEGLRNKTISDNAPAPIISTHSTVVPPETLVHTCQTCGKTFNVAIALSGHQGSHKKDLEKEITQE